ncbi:NAD(+)/NADH kinase [Halobaculum sp. P14]|uniref:NAD(+)/NADH kinase n=1 Tax=Halobaculum sp. P14 TaxID=3421638 RepID=UPI003EB79970
MTEFRVALAGDDGTVRAAIESAGGAVVGDAASADALVTFGEEALVEAALAEPDAPVLPVAAGDGAHSVSKLGVDSALAALAAGEAWTVDHPVLGVAVDGDRFRAVLDVTLLTAEPARISEYAVETREEPLAQFRSDGVVVATPAGSSGYARAAGGPVLTPGTGLSVVPIAPFTTKTETWVVDEPPTLTVERDEAAVQLLVDDDAERRVPAGVPVELRVDDAVELLRVPRHREG